MSTNGPFRSPLHDLHVAAGAAMTADAGWEMPARYGDAQAEASAARQDAAVADVTHWGRIRIRGQGAVELLGQLLEADVSRQEDDTVRPVTPLDSADQPLDRSRLVRLEDMWLLVTSPAARAHVLEEATGIGATLDVKVDDQTEKTAMIACLGPQAAGRLDTVLPITVSDMADASARTGSVLIAKYIALRSDLGGIASAPGGSQAPPVWRMEVILPAMLAGRAWRFITEKAGANHIAPIGTEAMAMLVG
jgi:aminomethyltransferase